MSKLSTLLDNILHGRSDANIRFSALCNLLKAFGFTERIKGDHHIFTKDGIEEILNIQPISSMAKKYQVKQVRNIILQYHLELE